VRYRRLWCTRGSCTVCSSKSSPTSHTCQLTWHRCMRGLEEPCNESRQPCMSSNRISSLPPHSCFFPSFPVTPNVHVWLSALVFGSDSMVVIRMCGRSAWNGERLMFYGSSFLCSLLYVRLPCFVPLLLPQFVCIRICFHVLHLGGSLLLAHVTEVVWTIGYIILIRLTI